MAKKQKRPGFTKGPGRPLRSVTLPGDTQNYAIKNPVFSGEITLPAGSIPRPSGGKSSALDFAAALMQGNPVAERALYEAMHRTGKEGEEPSFADQFIASTYSFVKNMKFTAHEAKSVEPLLAKYRDDMRRAHRFVLDDDFVRYATEISSTISPEKLLARLQFATLPYEITWIEHNLRPKVNVMHAIHGAPPGFDMSKVGERIGLLLYRINETDAVCQIVCEQEGMNNVMPSLLTFFFSITETSFGGKIHGPSGCRAFYSAGGNLDSHEANVIMESVGRGTLWGYSAKGGGAGMLADPTQLKSLHTPTFLERHGEIGWSRLCNAMSTLAGERGKKAYEVFASIMVMEATEFAGMMRWLVVVLGMLNEVPTRTQPMTPSGQMRVRFDKKHKFLDYHRVTLRLPKTSPVAWIERHLRNVERRHRAHEVRSFWRTYLNEVRCKPDEHEWVYDYDDGYALCGKCMAYRRHIREHIRGDASLGWVRKDYVVKKEGGA